MVIGAIYSEIGPADSAYYYLNQVMSSKTGSFTITEAYHALYDLSKRERKYKEAVSYGDKYLEG